MNERERLLPCPFCGGDEVGMLKPTCRPETLYNPADRLYPIVSCPCGASVSGSNEDYRGDTAVQIWNQRALLSQEPSEGLTPSEFADYVPPIEPDGTMTVGVKEREEPLTMDFDPEPSTSEEEREIPDAVELRQNQVHGTTRTEWTIAPDLIVRTPIRSEDEGDQAVEDYNTVLRLVARLKALALLQAPEQPTSPIQEFAHEFAKAFPEVPLCSACCTEDAVQIPCQNCGEPAQWIEEAPEQPASDMICEKHPELPWPHADCPGPGMPKAARVRMLIMQRRDLRRSVSDLESMVIQGRTRIGELEAPEQGERKLYVNRCGWCGAHEGTVDPDEACAEDETGPIGPHQFGVFELLHPEPTEEGKP